jgi:Flp pilus assembly protein CpaB
MNKNWILILALVALILIAGVIYMACSGRQDSGATTKIVVATKTLDLGALITKEDVRLVEWPKSAPLRGSFSDPSKVVGHVLRVKVQVNEPLLESKLAPKETRSQ